MLIDDAPNTSRVHLPVASNDANNADNDNAAKLPQNRQSLSFLMFVSSRPSFLLAALFAEEWSVVPPPRDDMHASTSTLSMSGSRVVDILQPCLVFRSFNEKRKV